MNKVTLIITEVWNKVVRKENKRTIVLNVLTVNKCKETDMVIMSR